MEENQTVFDPYYVRVNEITRDAVSVFVSLSFLLGVSGNILVVLVHRKIKEKSVTDWMIFYIAVCDILSLLNMPMYICQVEAYWTIGFPDILCKLHIFNSNSVSMASYFFCASTALERYFKIVASKDIFTQVRAKWLWIPMFVLSYGLGALAIKAVKNNANGHCSFDLEAKYLSTITYGSVMFVAVASSIIITLCYIRIGVYLVSKMKDIAQSLSNDAFAKSYKNSIQTTKMLAVVTVVFLFSANAPYVTGFIVSVTPPTQEPWMSVVFVFSAMFVVNNFVNPFLYMLMSTSFRQRSAEVMRSCCGNKYAISEKTSTKTTSAS